MLVLRKALTCTALLALGGLVLTTPAPGYVRDPDLRGVLLPLLLPLAATIAGVLAGRPWSRWLALAAGVAILPWAVVFVAGPSYGLDRTREWIALIASVGILCALLGPSAFASFEGLRDGAEWRGKRMSLVRWTLVLSLAAVLNLYLFATAYRPAAPWHSLIPGGLALGLVGGAWLLARRRTLGLLLLAPCALLLPPALIYYVLQQPVGGGERVLFAVLFTPAWLAAAATLVAFGGPMRRFARD